VVAAQPNVQIDAEMGKKDPFRMETSLPEIPGQAQVRREPPLDPVGASIVQMAMTSVFCRFLSRNQVFC